MINVAVAVKKLVDRKVKYWDASYKLRLALRSLRDTDYQWMRPVTDMRFINGRRENFMLRCMTCDSTSYKITKTRKSDATIEGSTAAIKGHG